MTLNEADEIRMEVGKFFEYVNPVLMRLFLADIPEFLLPYSKDTIVEALNIVKQSINDDEFSQVVDSLLVYLGYYTNSKTALKKASEKFINSEYVNAIMSTK